MGIVYSYQLRGRRPSTYLAGVLFLIVFSVGVYQGAPWYFYVPVLMGGAMIFYSLAKNPVHGLIVQSEALVLSAWDRPRSISIDDILSVELVSWSDSTDMMVHLKSGEKVPVPAGDVPPVEPLKDALAQVGVTLKQS